MGSSILEAMEIKVINLSRNNFSEVIIECHQALDNVPRQFELSYWIGFWVNDNDFDLGNMLYHFTQLEFPVSTQDANVIKDLDILLRANFRCHFAYDYINHLFRIKFVPFLLKPGVVVKEFYADTLTEAMANAQMDLSVQPA